jgi:ribosomal protein L11 methylase PrmA
VDLLARGLSSSHHDESHDQKLEQELELHGGKRVRIEGGTTKCARVMVQSWLPRWGADVAEDCGGVAIRGKTVLEVGAGTGLVGLGALLVAGAAHVVFTDQEPVLELLEHNVKANLREAQVDAPTLFTVAALQWGEEESARALGAAHDIDVVIGSDLIFAHENIPPLIATLCVLRKPLFLACINRFRWEERFFDGMRDARFSCECVFHEGDIDIFLFRPAMVVRR